MSSLPMYFVLSVITYQTMRTERTRANGQAHLRRHHQWSGLDRIYIREVHLWMLLHKLLQQIILLRLVTRRLVLPLHLLVVHHFLDHTSRLAVKIRQLAILGLNLGRVNLWCRCDNMRPPIRAGGFGKVYRDLFAFFCGF